MLLAVRAEPPLGDVILSVAAPVFVFAGMSRNRNPEVSDVGPKVTLPAVARVAVIVFVPDTDVRSGAPHPIWSLKAASWADCIRMFSSRPLPIVVEPEGPFAVLLSVDDREPKVLDT